MLPASDGYLGLQFKALAFLQGSRKRRGALSALALCRAATRPERLCGGNGASNGCSTMSSSSCPAARWDAAAEIALLLPEDVFCRNFVCMHTDRAAMQSSLEVRSPFLVVALVEFANRLPDRFKMKNGNLKILLRRAAAKRGLSAEIVEQRKQGFTFPVARWLKTTLRSPCRGASCRRRRCRTIDRPVDRAALRR
jgi:asparagine synthase (glutamine-hydrolysing)